MSWSPYGERARRSCFSMGSFLPCPFLCSQMTTAGRRMHHAAAFVNYIVWIWLSDPFFCRTVLAVAGHDYCIVASSTRLSTGYSILTRESSKMLQL